MIRFKDDNFKGIFISENKQIEKNVLNRWYTECVEEFKFINKSVITKRKLLCQKLIVKLEFLETLKIENVSDMLQKTKEIYNEVCDKLKISNEKRQKKNEEKKINKANEEKKAAQKIKIKKILTIGISIAAILIFAIIGIISTINKKRIEHKKYDLSNICFSIGNFQSSDMPENGRYISYLDLKLDNNSILKVSSINGTIVIKNKESGNELFSSDIYLSCNILPEDEIKNLKIKLTSTNDILTDYTLSNLDLYLKVNSILFDGFETKDYSDSNYIKLN
jgi:hypothetical protein